MKYFREIRFNHRQLLLVGLTIGLIFGGAMLARRFFQSPQTEWPDGDWKKILTIDTESHGGTVYINLDDVAAGISPPRLKWVPLPNQNDDPEPKNTPYRTSSVPSQRRSKHSAIRD